MIKSNKASHPNMFLLIGKAYLNLNKINEAKKKLSQVENLNEFKKNENRVLFRYYELVADVARVEKRNEEAVKYYKKASEYRDDFNPEIFDKFKNSTELENKSLHSNFQLQKEMADDTSTNSVSIYIDNPTSIYLTFTFGLLVLLIVLQFRYSRIKTKTNELLNKKNEQLNELLETKNKFLNIIAHELRTPLNAITSILYLLKEKYNKTENENLVILEHSSDHLISLSNNIIEYNVLSNDKRVKLQNTQNNLKELAGNILDSFRKTDNNENKVTFLYDEQLSMFFLLDKLRLTQVLNNIIDNAFKFSEKGNIIVKLEFLDKNVENNFETIRFSVEDDGIGIDNTIKNEIFNLFFQGSEEISIKYGGSGIGLALVKKTLKLFKTKLEIISKDKGTIVFFDLTLQSIQKSKSEFETEPEKNNLCSKKHILVVEDNKINQILVEKILISKGYTCAIAENGLEAVKMVKNNDYCLILMDIMMPIMNGYEASEEIGKIKPDLPIVALTAVSEELNKEKFEKVQIKKVLNKPINVDQLDKVLNLYCV